MSPIRLRFAVLTAAVLLPLWGCAGLPDDRPRISIEFGAYPELFEGCPVLIDGKAVGKLETTGRATRISFPVDIGQHEVCIKSPRMGCQPTKVSLDMRAQKVHLIADIADSTAADGTPQSVIVLRP